MSFAITTLASVVPWGTGSLWFEVVLSWFPFISASAPFLPFVGLVKVHQEEPPIADKPGSYGVETTAIVAAAFPRGGQASKGR